MGSSDEYIEMILTCKGDYYDPTFHSNLDNFSTQLQELITKDKKLILKKVEPWNSVRVTFNIPRDAARRLRILAEQGSDSLRELGVLGVQIEGDRLISLTLAGRTQPTQLMFNTSAVDTTAPTRGPTRVTTPPNRLNANNVQISDYLVRTGESLFETFFTRSRPTNIPTPTPTTIAPTATTTPTTTEHVINSRPGSGNNGGVMNQHRPTIPRPQNTSFNRAPTIINTTPPMSSSPLPSTQQCPPPQSPLKPTRIPQQQTPHHLPHQQTPHQHTPHQQTPHQHTPHQHTPHQHTPHQQSLHQQAIHQQTLHQQTPHQQTPHQPPHISPHHPLQPSPQITNQHIQPSTNQPICQPNIPVPQKMPSNSPISPSPQPPLIQNIPPQTLQLTSPMVNEQFVQSTSSTFPPTDNITDPITTNAPLPVAPPRFINTTVAQQHAAATNLQASPSGPHKGITSSSPLLVNLLQNDAASIAAAAAAANFTHQQQPCTSSNIILNMSAAVIPPQPLNSNNTLIVINQSPVQGSITAGIPIRMRQASQIETNSVPSKPRKPRKKKSTLGSGRSSANIVAEQDVTNQLTSIYTALAQTQNRAAASVSSTDATTMPGATNATKSRTIQSANMRPPPPSYAKTEVNTIPYSPMPLQQRSTVQRFPSVTPSSTAILTRPPSLHTNTAIGNLERGFGISSHTRYPSVQTKQINSQLHQPVRKASPQHNLPASVTPPTSSANSFIVPQSNFIIRPISMTGLATGVAMTVNNVLPTDNVVISACTVSSIPNTTTTTTSWLNILNTADITRVLSDTTAASSGDNSLSTVVSTNAAVTVDAGSKKSAAEVRNHTEVVRLLESGLMSKRSSPSSPPPPTTASSTQQPPQPPPPPPLVAPPFISVTTCSSVISQPFVSTALITVLNDCSVTPSTVILSKHDVISTKTTISELNGTIVNGEISKCIPVTCTNLDTKLILRTISNIQPSPSTVSMAAISSVTRLATVTSSSLSRMPVSTNSITNTNTAAAPIVIPDDETTSTVGAKSGPPSNMITEPSYARSLTQSVLKVVQALPAMDSIPEDKPQPPLPSHPAPTLILSPRMPRATVVGMNRVPVTDSKIPDNETLSLKSTVTPTLITDVCKSTATISASSIEYLSIDVDNESDDDDDDITSMPIAQIILSPTRIDDEDTIILTNGDDTHSKNGDDSDDSSIIDMHTSRSLKRKLSSPCSSPHRNGLRDLKVSMCDSLHSIVNRLSNAASAITSDDCTSETSSTCTATSPAEPAIRTTRSSKRVSKPTDFFDESLDTTKLQVKRGSQRGNRCKADNSADIVDIAESVGDTKSISANDISDLKAGITQKMNAQLPTCEADTKYAHLNNSHIEDSIPISDLKDTKLKQKLMPMLKSVSQSNEVSIKRSTRSSKSKVDHCELPPPPQKKRRPIKDHR